MCGLESPREERAEKEAQRTTGGQRPESADDLPRRFLELWAEIARYKHNTNFVQAVRGIEKGERGDQRGGGGASERRGVQAEPEDAAVFEEDGKDWGMILIHNLNG